MKKRILVPTQPYSNLLNTIIQEGYTLTEITRSTGLNYNTVKNIIRNKTPKITSRTADIISKLYQEYLNDKDTMEDFNTFAKGLDTIKVVLIVGAIGAMALVFMYFAIRNN